MVYSRMLCEACQQPEFHYYSYGNHSNRCNARYLRSLFFFLGRPFLKPLLPKLPTLYSKHLFSSFYKIRRCKYCGLGKYDRGLTQADLDTYYRNMYWQSGGMPRGDWDNPKIYREHERAIGQYDFVKDDLKVTPDYAMLDIGAAGALPARLIRERFDNKIQLDVVETGQGWKAYYDHLGIHRVAETFPFSSQRRYDYIHASGWLEHIWNVDVILQRLHQCLKPQGLVFIEVPNCVDSYFLAEFDYRDIPHVYFFTVLSLKLIFEKHGFQTVKCGEFGEKHAEHYRRRNFGDVPGQTLKAAYDSSTKNIHREGGITLRGLFKKL